MSSARNSHWGWGILASAIGLAGVVIQGIRNFRSAPAFDDPMFWLWVVSPFLAWAYLANPIASTRSLIITISSVISGLGGLLLIIASEFAPHQPGGMNPWGGRSVALEMIFLAILQWSLLVAVLVGIQFLKPTPND